MVINNKIARKIKQDFPIFRNNRGLIYLDNAATSQKPWQVIKAVADFYERNNSNVGRGLYMLSERSMENYDNARKAVAEFINASPDEIIFTKNTTESLNLLSYTFSSIIPGEKDEIILTEMEHHSNLVPWQMLAKREKMKLRIIKIKEDFTLDMEDAAQKITDRAAILSFAYVSNVTGTINDVRELVSLGKKKGAITVVDAAQGISSLKIDVRDLGCDFLAFSSHKILGPTGIGVLYGRKELLEKMPPFTFGGGMIKKVELGNAEWADIPEKFEAGTQDIAGAVGLGEAIRYLKKIGLENISGWKKQLTNYALEKLKEVPKIKIYSPAAEKNAGIISFNLGRIHPHDVSALLDEKGIAIRAGHCCAMPLMKKLGLPQGVSRISFSVFNTSEEIDRLADTLKEIESKLE
jgi:cysteine desulfurase/selenocysteine lyase